MSYTAIRKKATPMILGILLLIAAGVCGSLAALERDHGGLLQIMATACLCGMLLLGRRYFTSGYIYYLDSWEEITQHNRLTVVRTVKTYRVTALSESLSHLREVIPYCRYRRLKAQYGKPARCLDLSADLWPSESYWLLFETNGDLMAVRLQCDASFAEALKARAGV